MGVAKYVVPVPVEPRGNPRYACTETCFGFAMSVDHQGSFVKYQSVAPDAFLGGKLSLRQPTRGFRAGSDSVMLGASVSAGTERILDLGAGVGCAGLVAAVWSPAATVLLAEREPELAELAAANAVENGLAHRASAVAVDVTGPGDVRVSAGLLPDQFTSVIANPPFFETGGGTLSSDAARAGARHAEAQSLDRWVRTAAACAAPGGEAIFVYPAARITELLSAFAVRFGAICVLPLAGRPGEDAGRVLVRGIKGSRAPLRLLAQFVLHGESGNAPSVAARSVLMGDGRLDW